MKIGEKFDSLEAVRGIFAEHPSAKQIIVWHRAHEDSGQFELIDMLDNCAPINWEKAARQSGFPYERNKKRGWEMIRGYNIAQDAVVYRFRRL